MAETLSFSGLNPFANFSLGSMGTLGSSLLIIALAVVIIAMIGFLIFIFVIKKKYWIKIHVYRLIGNTPTRVAIYSAREVPFGLAGDKLWRVSNIGFNKIPTVKWLPVGKKQTAPTEFWYWIRNDGEWINFSLDDIDEISSKMNVRFVQEDMRLQRLATDRLLEQRHMKKNFWDQWGTTIMTLMFFLVITICMIIIFYQYSKILDKLAPLIDTLTKSLKIVEQSCRVSYNSSGGGIVIPLD